MPTTAVTKLTFATGVVSEPGFGTLPRVEAFNDLGLAATGFLDHLRDGFLG